MRSEIAPDLTMTNVIGLSSSPGEQITVTPPLLIDALIKQIDLRNWLSVRIRQLVGRQFDPMAIRVREVHRVSNCVILKMKRDLLFTEFVLRPFEVDSVETEREMTQSNHIMIRYWKRLGRLRGKER